jgi:hypothetical protein
MRIVFVAVPALVLAGVAAAQDAARPDPRDPRSKVPPVEYRSAFDGYRPFVEPELRDWRRANEEVGAARGHGGRNSEPQPAKPEGPGHHKGHK